MTPKRNYEMEFFRHFLCKSHYRMVEEGEKIRENDEFFRGDIDLLTNSRIDYGWNKVPNSAIGAIYSHSRHPCRRIR